MVLYLTKEVVYYNVNLMPYLINIQLNFCHKKNQTTVKPVLRGHYLWDCLIEVTTWAGLTA
jgi:hypothetical protein